MADEEGEPAPGPGQEVLVVQGLSGPAPRRRRRRARAAKETDEIPLTRLTVVRAEQFPGEAEAAEWIDGMERNAEQLAEEAELGLVLINRALHAVRTSAGDPYIHELSLERAVAIRVGYGTGEQVAEGRWSEAKELEPGDPRSRRRRREGDLRPQERVAAVLGHREEIDTCEALLARARIDLDAGRMREAALQLRVGLEALLLELRGALQDPGHEEDMAALSERRGEVGDAANAALRGELDEPTAGRVRELIEIAERVLRRRRVLRG